MLRAVSTTSNTDKHAELWASNNTTIIIQTSDGASITVDKELLITSSKFWSDMLSTCDTGHITLDEAKDTIELLLQVVRDEPQPSTFSMPDSSCWDVYKRVLVVADKYDMHVVRDRVEKWLVSRCLRGKTRCSDFKFQDLRMGQEWLQLCCTYNLRCLGWFVAYDLGSQLAATSWGMPTNEFLAGVSDPEMLKTMLEGVSDAVQLRVRPRAAGGAGGGGGGAPEAAA